MKEQKLHYSIGQVAEYLDLPQSVLRYWETVFDRLNPEKSPGGNRLYSEEDINIIGTIKNLLYGEGFTIKGANHKLNTLFPENQSEVKQPEATHPGEGIHTGTEKGLKNQSGPAQETWSADKVIDRIRHILKILDE